MVKKAVAYIFPGQGSQSVGMGKGLYDNFSQAKEIFDRADEITGLGLKELCFNGPQEKLSTTAYSQPAILTTSIAALRSLESRVSGLDVKASLGLSLGEYTALVAAGSLEFEDGLKLVKYRGAFMEDASRENPGRMASIIGLDNDTVRTLCKETGCEIANLNCPGQVVISGKSGAIGNAAEAAKAKGAKRAIILDVSGPFHSSLMKSARDRLKGVLDNVNMERPSMPFIGNVNAAFESDPANIKENLLKQLTGSTRWEDSIRLLAAEGVKIFLEIGPGKVLKGLLRRIDADLTVYNIGVPEDIDRTVEDLSKIEVGG
jgi:[acyl-carrier-protein] S-malonyltransferase